MTPGLDFNEIVLYASPKPVPKELLREPIETFIAPESSCPGRGKWADLCRPRDGQTLPAQRCGMLFPSAKARALMIMCARKPYCMVAFYQVGQNRTGWICNTKISKLVTNSALYRAPMRSPKNMLDIATGTGISAIQFAKEHPESNVVGTDLSTIQPCTQYLFPSC